MEKEKEKEKERERKGQTETYTDRDRQRQRQTDRDRQTETQTDTDRDRQTQPLTARCKQPRANTAAPNQKLWSKMALITPHLILRVVLSRKQQEEGVGIRDEIRKRFALAERGDMEQLLKGAIEDQEKQ